MAGCVRMCANVYVYMRVCMCVCVLGAMEGTGCVGAVM